MPNKPCDACGVNPHEDKLAIPHVNFRDGPRWCWGITQNEIDARLKQLKDMGDRWTAQPTNKDLPKGSWHIESLDQTKPIVSSQLSPERAELITWLQNNAYALLSEIRELRYRKVNEAPSVPRTDVNPTTLKIMLDACEKNRECNGSSPWYFEAHQTSYRINTTRNSSLWRIAEHMGRDDAQRMCWYHNNEKEILTRLLQSVQPTPQQQDKNAKRLSLYLKVLGYPVHWNAAKTYASCVDEIVKASQTLDKDADANQVLGLLQELPAILKKSKDGHEFNRNFLALILEKVNEKE
jgi:hypothetical protein